LTTWKNAPAASRSWIGSSPTSSSMTVFAEVVAAHSDGAAYEVEVTRDDGTQVEVPHTGLVGHRAHACKVLVRGDHLVDASRRRLRIMRG
jgi:hypothetical protein